MIISKGIISKSGITKRSNKVTCAQAIHFASRDVMSATILRLEWFIFFVFALYNVVSLCLKQRSNDDLQDVNSVQDYVISFE